eukprot:gene13028-8874_t
MLSPFGLRMVYTFARCDGVLDILLDHFMLVILGLVWLIVQRGLACYVVGITSLPVVVVVGVVRLLAGFVHFTLCGFTFTCLLCNNFLAWLGCVPAWSQVVCFVYNFIADLTVGQCMNCGCDTLCILEFAVLRKVMVIKASACCKLVNGGGVCIVSYYMVCCGLHYCFAKYTIAIDFYVTLCIYKMLAMEGAWVVGLGLGGLLVVFDVWCYMVLFAVYLISFVDWWLMGVLRARLVSLLDLRHLLLLRCFVFVLMVVLYMEVKYFRRCCLGALFCFMAPLVERGFSCISINVFRLIFDGSYEPFYAVVLISGCVSVWLITWCGIVYFC